MKTPFPYSRSIRLAGLVTMIAATSLIQACSSDAIVTAPSNIARSSTPDATPIRVSGTVTDDDGMPVADARVTVYRWTPQGEPRSTVTDGKGHYSVSFLKADGIAVRTEKAGYESAWHSRSTSQAADFQFDLRIHRIKP